MPTENTQLRSEAVQDILTKVPNWMIRWGNTWIFLLLLLFISLSWFIKYPDIISAQALLTTEIPPQKEYARSTGKLSHIFVSNAENVSSGMDLAVIENGASYKDVGFLKGYLDTLSHTKDQFDFPFQEIPLLSLGDIDLSYAQFQNDYLRYEHNRKLQPFEAKRQSLRFSRKELTLQLENLQNQQEITKKKLLLEETDLDREEEGYKIGVSSRRDLDQRRIAYLESELAYIDTETSISQLKESIKNSETDHKIKEGENQIEKTRLFNNTIQSFNQLKKAINDWEMKYVLRSQIVGTISFLDFWSINQQVKVGDVLFIVIPDQNQNHLAKLKVPALNSGKLAIGQKVYLKLDNYPNNEFGKLESSIASISAIPDGEGNYSIDMLLPQTLITTYDREIPFQSEMTGTAEIITEDLRLIERLFYELRGLFEN